MSNFDYSIYSFVEYMDLRFIEITTVKRGKGCGQSLATNALKHLMDQLEERILQTDQLKNSSKCCRASR